MVSWSNALRKTRAVFSTVLQGVVSDGIAVDELTLEELEVALIRADLPPRLVAELIDDLEQNQLFGNDSPREVLRRGLRAKLLMSENDPFATTISPTCVLLLGVNGAGKTTTCAKLAHRAAGQKRKVMLGAADTFRAAGTEQLRLWGERLKVPVVSGRQGSDASAVAYDALDAAIARDMELLFIDTAGRMHTKSHLMDELKKMVRALQKRDPAAPHETWMILDASLGQNSLNQAKIFHEAVPLTGLVITKLDGSSKAGFLFNVQRELPEIPVLFTGLGEQAEDLVRFDADAFVDAMLTTDGEMHPPEHWMRLAVDEARKGLGFTAPNPAVGAVVVKEDRLLGKGFHAKAGEPHAEPMALRDAGDAARGADLYVTLEPCCTHGKTPPCTEAIKAAGIRRVSIGCTDPNPAHAGRAYAILREAGIEVFENVLGEACRDVIRAFAHVQRTGFPYVSLKLATSLDGRIADAAGTSQWITGPESRERVQALRREADAILAGTETLRLDNPSLQPRPSDGHRPWRIVPDRTGTLPLSLKVFTDEFRDRTLCLLGPEAPAERRSALDAAGVSWMNVPTRNGVLLWKEFLPELAKRSIHHLLCEGGGKLSAALLDQHLVRELFWFQAPMLLGRGGRPAVAAEYLFADAPRLTRVSCEELGADLFARYFPMPS